MCAHPTHDLPPIHADFQLWITTEPHAKFPIGLLQTSIKITNEAPAGVRAGLKASYAWLNQVMRCCHPTNELLLCVFPSH